MPTRDTGTERIPNRYTKANEIEDHYSELEQKTINIDDPGALGHITCLRDDNNYKRQTQMEFAPLLCPKRASALKSYFDTFLRIYFQR